MTAPTVAVVVMAHRRRARYVTALLNALDVPATVVWDRHGSMWSTGRAALQTGAQHDATHVLCCQDDAIVCRDFTATVAAQLAAVPDGHPLALYWPNIRHGSIGDLYTRTARAGRRYITSPRLPMFGVALAIPTAHVEPLVAYADQLNITAYDGRIRRYYLHAGIAPYAPIPSPVDHRCGPDTASLTPGRRNDSNRHARDFIGANTSGLTIDWTDNTTRNPI